MWMSVAAVAVRMAVAAAAAVWMAVTIVRCGPIAPLNTAALRRRDETKVVVVVMHSAQAGRWTHFAVFVLNQQSKFKAK